MDALASMLATKSDEIGSAARGLVSRAESMDFLGPAATRFRAVVATNDSTARDVATRALELSHVLRRAAQTARMQIAAWERQQAARERER